VLDVEPASPRSLRSDLCRKTDEGQHACDQAMILRRLVDHLKQPHRTGVV